MNALKTENGFASVVRAFHEDEGGMEALQVIAILCLAAVALFAVNHLAQSADLGEGKGGIIGTVSSLLTKGFSAIGSLTSFVK